MQPDVKTTIGQVCNGDADITDVEVSLMVGLHYVVIMVCLVLVCAAAATGIIFSSIRGMQHMPVGKISS